MSEVKKTKYIVVNGRLAIKSKQYSKGEAVELTAGQVEQFTKLGIIGDTLEKFVEETKKDSEKKETLKVPGTDSKK